MSKGSGKSGGKLGSGSVSGTGKETRMSGDSQVNSLLRQGFSGAVPQQGLRPESFAHLRSGGAVHGGDPILSIHSDGKVHIVDGRHRITLARESGQRSLNVRIQTMGPRGGVKFHGTYKLKLNQAGNGLQNVGPKTPKPKKR